MREIGTDKAGDSYIYACIVMASEGGAVCVLERDLVGACCTRPLHLHAQLFKIHPVAIQARLSRMYAV